MKIYPKKELTLGKKDLSLQVKLQMETLKVGNITGVQKKNL